MSVVNSGGVIIAHEYGVYNGYITWDPSGSLPHSGRELVLASYTISDPQVRSGNLRQQVLYHEAAHLLNYTDEATAETGSAYDFADMCTEAETTEIDTEMQQTGGNDGKHGDQTCYWIVWYWKYSGEHIKTDFLGCFG